MFKIIDGRRMLLPVANAPVDRWERRAIIAYNTREFMVFLDTYFGGVGYIEEIVGGHLETINDNSMYKAISEFVDRNRLLIPLPPLRGK
jgi:hypothetical protein